MPGGQWSVGSVPDLAARVLVEDTGIDVSAARPDEFDAAVAAACAYRPALADLLRALTLDELIAAEARYADEDAALAAGVAARQEADPRRQAAARSQRAYVTRRRGDAARLRDRRREVAGTRPSAPHVAPRPRGAGRPRAAASRSSARSGDSGDDGPASGDDEPSSSASAGRPPSLAFRSTQRERLLVALRRARRGITAADLTGPTTIDGGPPIRHLSRVVAELRAAGHVIRARRVRAGYVSVTVYALDREAAPPPRHPHAAELTGEAS